MVPRIMHANPARAGVRSDSDIWTLSPLVCYVRMLGFCDQPKLPGVLVHS
jgi:hypothetical protein